jgi:5-formyltetrahydrofolate cyclo-ligase
LSRKRELRKAILAARDQLTREQVARLSRQIRQRLFSQEAFQRARTILFFHTMGSEVDTRPMIEAALRAGKRVALPRVAACGCLELRQIRPEQRLQPGPMGILEPGSDCPLVPDEEVELVVVPAVVWDREGYRAGYGGGYYDRLLARLGRATRIGLGFELQVVEQVPREPHDLPVDLLLTEAASRDFRPRRAS